MTNATPDKIAHRRLLSSVWISGLTFMVLFGLSQTGAPAQPPRGEASKTADNPQQAEASDTPREGRIVVARLTYQNNENSDAEPVCLSDGFLSTVARETDQPIQRTFDTVAIEEDALFEYPFVVLTGGWSFSLTERQKRNLKRYLDQGGFILASASCSNRRWAQSFESLIAELYPDKNWQTIEADHPLRHTLYEIERIDKRKPSDTKAIRGLTIADRLAVVYSPVGLNDTANAGGGCCCCGGNEVTNARQVNANILTYALTH